MKPTPIPPGETPEERIIRKAGDLRAACIEFGLVWSPDAEMAFAELPPARQEKWLKLAKTYVEEIG